MEIPRFRKLHTRIVLAFALLLVLAQAASLSSLDRILTRSTREDIEQGVLTGERIFRHVCDTNGRQLAQAAKVLASDYAFRQAVATGDQSTIRSALANHGTRIHAPLMILSGLDDRVIADTLGHGRAGQPFPFQGLVEPAAREGQATAMGVLDGRLYQLVVVPVLAPVAVAWLGVGAPIDEAFAQNLRSLTGLEVSFVVKAGGAWQPLASTLPVPAALGPLELEAPRSLSTQTMAGEGFVTLGLRLDGPAGNAPVAVLHRPLAALGTGGYRAAALDGGIGGGRIYLAAYAARLGATGLTFFDDDVCRFFALDPARFGVMFLTAAGVPA